MGHTNNGKAQIYYHTEMYEETVKNYEPLYPFLKDQIKFLFEYGRSLYMSEQPEKSNDILRQAMQINEMREEAIIIENERKG